jgi:hypothetical protein
VDLPDTPTIRLDAGGQSADGSGRFEVSIPAGFRVEIEETASDGMPAHTFNASGRMTITIRPA